MQVRVVKSSGSPFFTAQDARFASLSPLRVLAALAAPSCACHQAPLSRAVRSLLSPVLCSWPGFLRASRFIANAYGSCRRSAEKCRLTRKNEVLLAPRSDPRNVYLKLCSGHELRRCRVAPTSGEKRKARNGRRISSRGVARLWTGCASSSLLIAAVPWCKRRRSSSAATPGNSSSLLQIERLRVSPPHRVFVQRGKGGAKAGEERSRGVHHAPVKAQNYGRRLPYKISRA